jgi:hypothetical protein
MKFLPRNLGVVHTGRRRLFEDHVRRNPLNGADQSLASMRRQRRARRGMKGSACMALRIIAGTGFVAGAFLIATSSGVSAYTGHALEKNAKINLQQASAIALKARPGEITDRELEREAGGSGLRYSFDVKSRGVTYEIGVDALTGTVLENVKEGLHPD